MTASILTLHDHRSPAEHHALAGFHAAREGNLLAAYGHTLEALNEVRRMVERMILDTEREQGIHLTAADIDRLQEVLQPQLLAKAPADPVARQNLVNAIEAAFDRLRTKRAA